MQLVIELPARPKQIAFNRQRWHELLADQELAKLPYRVETNAHGQLVMNPPPSGDHSVRQSKILLKLSDLMGGRPLAECPISTIDGVKAVDVGWYSDTRFAEVKGQIAFERAPEICVEVISPSNTTSEMNQKKQLYIEAGADEVWFCHMDGRMEFFPASSPDAPHATSLCCPDFPKVVDG